MIYIKRKWADDYVVERCKCNDCHNVWVVDDISIFLCPNCGSDDWDGCDFEIQKIKEMERSKDGALLYALV